MSQAFSNSPVPFAILRKLQLIRQRKLIVQAAVAFVAAVAVLLAAMAVAMLIDWLATLYDSRWRYVLTATAVTAAAVTGGGWLLVAWRRLLGVERIAGDVDRHIPQLAERWTTMTRLGPLDAGNPQVVHPAMLRRVATEAESWEPHVEPEQVVSMSGLMRAMLGLTAITVVLGVAVIFNSYQTLVLLQRFWLPGSSISATRLVNVPGDIVVGRGEPLALAAELAGTPVENAMLFVRSEKDPTRTITLVAKGEEPIEFSHRVRTVESPFEYRFRAGDGQTDWFSVGVADRPEIDALELTVTPPAYTRQAAKTFDKLPPRVAALEKSELEFKVRPTIPVKSVELQLGNDKRVSLAADGEGWYRWKTPLMDGFTLAPILTEPNGLTNQRVPKCEFTVYKDKPPAVKVVTPDDKLAVRPDDTIQIAFTATDDVGIGTAELLVYDEAAAAAGEEPVPIAAIPIPLGDQAGARSVQETVALDLSKFTVEDGSELSYEIRVREDRGGATVGAQTASSHEPANQPQSNQVAANGQASGEQQEQVSATDSKNQGSATTTANDQSVASDKSSSQGESQSGSSGAQTASTQKPSPGEAQTEAASQSGNADAQQTVLHETPQREDAAEQTEARDADAKSADGEKIAAKTQTGNDRPDGNSAPQASENKEPSADAIASKGDSSQANESSAASKASDDARKTANKSTNAASGSGAEQQKSADADERPRTATTGRQSLAGNRDARQPQSDDEMSDPQQGAQRPSSNTAKESQAPQPARQQANSQKSPTAASQANKDEKQPSSASDPPPGDSMTRRSLDVAQSSSSNRMRLSVDQWAGSFESQQRAKLEMAIAPELDALDKTLAKAQKTSRGVLDQLEAKREWRGTHDRDVANAERSAEESQGIVKRLQDRSKDTPYAFIGLQVADISQAHIGPARTNFWKALESEGDDRTTSVRDGWQHVGRARELVAELRGQYERARREFQLAESVERVKKMYQVYLENSQALLETQSSDPTRYGRKMVEFDLDDEYLKRLQQVMEMRRDLRAELARILAEDPRLLRRFMDSLRYRSNSLREELSKLVNDQADLNREVRAWTLVDEADRPRIEKILLLRQVQDAAKVATAAGELQTRYQTWLPLDRESKDDELAAATRTIQEMATAASELNSSAQKFVVDAQRVTAAPAEGEADAESAEVPAASGPAVSIPQQPLDDMLADAQLLYERLNKSEVALRQLAARDGAAETATFAANRLVDTRRLIADSSAWVRQTRAHKAGKYAAAAEVDQYRLAMKTDELAGKLGSIEQTLAGLMQRSDGGLPQPIAEKAREFISTLDKQVSPNQLAAVYALHSNQMPRVTDRQKAAGEALTKAEATYDELMRLAIEELDKLPVQDPVADLLDDPTLDELLAQLEQELPLEELLGIPQRPSNLRIVGDWMRPGGDNALSTGGASMAMNQLRQNEQQARQRLNRAYQRAIARALKESVPKTKVEIPQPTKLSEWNRLVSKLGDDLQQGRDKAPPEQYRRAIEQYFAQISRAVAEQQGTTE